LVVLGCLALSFMFSGAEVALFSPWKGKVNKSVSILRARPYALMTTILLGNTMVNSVGAAVFVSYLHGIGAVPEWVISVLEVLVFTLLLLIFSEITPKTLAMRSPQRFARLSAPGLWPFHLLFYPVSWVLQKLFSGLRSQTDSPGLLEMRRAFRAEARWHLFEDAVGLFVARLRSVATPRRKLRYLKLNDTVKRLRKMAVQTGHGHFPVVGKGLDDIKGYVWVGDFIGMPEDTRVKSLIKECPFLLDTTKLVDAMKIMATNGWRFAVVVDEFGGTVGVVTPRDIAGHLLGGLDFTVKSVGAGEFILSGNADVAAVERLTGAELGPPEEDLVGLFSRHLSRLPEEGDVLEIDGVRITVLEKKGEDITRVKVEVLK